MSVLITVLSVAVGFFASIFLFDFIASRNHKKNELQNLWRGEFVSDPLIEIIHKDLERIKNRKNKSGSSKKGKHQ